MAEEEVLHEARKPQDMVYLQQTSATAFSGNTKMQTKQWWHRLEKILKGLFQMASDCHKSVSLVKT